MTERRRGAPVAVTARHQPCRSSRLIVLDVEETGSGARNDRPARLPACPPGRPAGRVRSAPGLQTRSRRTLRPRPPREHPRARGRPRRQVHGHLAGPGPEAWRRRDQPAVDDGARRDRGVRTRLDPGPNATWVGGGAPAGRPARPTFQAGARWLRGSRESGSGSELEPSRRRARMQHRESPPSRHIIGCSPEKRFFESNSVNGGDTMNASAAQNLLVALLSSGKTSGGRALLITGPWGCGKTHLRPPAHGRGSPPPAPASRDPAARTWRAPPGRRLDRRATDGCASG